MLTQEYGDPHSSPRREVRASTADSRFARLCTNPGGEQTTDPSGFRPGETARPAASQWCPMQEMPGPDAKDSLTASGPPRRRSGGRSDARPGRFRQARGLGLQGAGDGS